MVADHGIVNAQNPRPCIQAASLAGVVRIGLPAPIGDTETEIAPGGALLRFTRGRVIDQPIAFDDVQPRRVGRAVHVHHRERSELHADGVDDQRVAFIMADGIAIPGWRHVIRMGRVEADMADFIAIGIENGDAVGSWNSWMPIFQNMKGTPPGQHWLEGVG